MGTSCRAVEPSKSVCIAGNLIILGCRHDQTSSVSTLECALLYECLGPSKVHEEVPKQTYNSTSFIETFQEDLIFLAETRAPKDHLNIVVEVDVSN